MKTKVIGFLIIIFSLIIACDNDPCESGYTEYNENGSSVCLPDYVVGIENTKEYGNVFFHSEHGVIKYQDKKWLNQRGEEIKP